MLPLDVGNKGNFDRILTWLKDQGYEILSDFAMGLSVEQIKNCPDADLNLVVARSGLAAARFLEKKYGIPYICGLPLGDGAELKGRLERQEHFQPLPETRSDKKGILLIHEQIFANELRVLLSKKTDVPITVGSLFGLEEELKASQDIHLPDERSVIREINSGKYQTILADPEFEKLIRREDVRLVALPHLAVSSKLHWDEYPDYLGEDVLKIIESTAKERN